MNFRTTGILAVLLLALLGYVYFGLIPGWETERREHEMRRRVVKPRPTEVVRISLIRPESRIVAEKSGFSWRIVHPVDTPADYDVLRGIVAGASAIEREGVAADSAQIASGESVYSDFGLDAPRLGVVLERRDGHADSLYFGDDSPTGSYIYLRRSSEPGVSLVWGVNHDGLDQELFDLRDRRYVAFDPDMVTRLSLERWGQRVVVERKDSAWELVSPFEDRADDGAVSRYLAELRDARFELLVDDAPGELSDYGLDSPWLTIQLTSGKENLVQEIVFGDTTDVRAYRKYIAKNSDNPFLFGADSVFVHELASSPDYFRVKTIFAMDRGRVNRLRIVYPDSALEFAKGERPDSWEVVSHPGTRTYAYRIEDLIDGTDQMRAMRFVAESMSEQPRSVLDREGIHVQFLDGSELLREVVFGSLGGFYYASPDDRDVVVEVDRGFASAVKEIRLFAEAPADSSD